MLYLFFFASVKKSHIKLEALRDIAPGDEVTYNYGGDSKLLWWRSEVARVKKESVPPPELIYTSSEGDDTSISTIDLRGKKIIVILFF